MLPLKLEAPSSSWQAKELRKYEGAASGRVAPISTRGPKFETVPRRVAIAVAEAPRVDLGTAGISNSRFFL